MADKKAGALVSRSGGAASRRGRVRWRAPQLVLVSLIGCLLVPVVGVGLWLGWIAGGVVVISDWWFRWAYRVGLFPHQWRKELEWFSDGN